MAVFDLDFSLCRLMSQLEGFIFERGLDMRMSGPTAADLVNTVRKTLSDILYFFGEERQVVG